MTARSVRTSTLACNPPAAHPKLGAISGQGNSQCQTLASTLPAYSVHARGQSRWIFTGKAHDARMAEYERLLDAYDAAVLRSYVRRQSCQRRSSHGSARRSASTRANHVAAYPAALTDMPQLSSTQGIKYPKLRTRVQITLRFAQVAAELDHWREQRKHWREGAAWQTAQPRVLAKVEQHITECEAQLDALRYALNDVV